MQRRRSTASPRTCDDRADALDYPEAEAERWARVVAHRDRQLHSAVLVQRSMRRFLNRTYERDACARRIQAFVRRYVLGRRRRTRRGSEATILGRRRENATIRPPSYTSSPSSPRTPRGGGVRTDVVYDDGYAMGYAHPGGGVEAAEYVTEDEMEDDDTRVRWGKTERRSEQSRGGRRRENYLQDPGEVTRSTAPLTESQASVWADFHSSSTSSGSSGRSLTSPQSGGPLSGGLEYEVFVWQNRQHALEFEPCTFTGFPSVVEAASVNIALPGMWNVRDGDLLVSINDFSTHPSEMPFSDVEQILESGVRPAILRFRRPRIAFGRSESSDYYVTRDRPGLGRAMSMASVRSSSGGGGYGGGYSSSRQDIRKQQERAEALLCYVVYREEDESLGLVLTEERGKPYLVVSSVRSDGAAALASTLTPRVSEGDMLLYINDWNVRLASLENVVAVLTCSPRPLVLTFRRMRPVYRTYEL